MSSIGFPNIEKKSLVSGHSLRPRVLHFGDGFSRSIPLYCPQELDRYGGRV
jgi:hypothetical protein